MRRKDKLVTDIDALHRVIRKAHVCRLALVDNDRPYVVPMNFGFDGAFVYLHAAKEGRKIDILRNNNRVCVEFEQDVALVPGKKPCDYGFRYFTVICHGYAEFVDVLEEKRWALEHIIRHYEPEWQRQDFKEWEVASIVIIKITIDEITGKVSGVQWGVNNLNC
jgi:nitroimidazol reductase NimA-like FMN-containing flavoprotein (pyridoxamine 5'-phosphate oxidase superfamily)